MNDGFVRFNCESCGRKAKARAVDVGKGVKCPACGATMMVPGTLWMEPADALPADVADIPTVDAVAPPIPDVPPILHAGHLPTDATDQPVHVDLTSGIPGLSRSASYSLTDRRYGISHRPTTTFGHAFGGSFGCILGIVAAGFVLLICMIMCAGLGNALVPDNRPSARQR